MSFGAILASRRERHISHVPQAHVNQDGKA